jgi:hypothetical protein
MTMLLRNTPMLLSPVVSERKNAESPLADHAVPKMGLRISSGSGAARAVMKTNIEAPSTSGMLLVRYPRAHPVDKK